jgi:hypothetical protein
VFLLRVLSLSESGKKKKKKKKCKDFNQSGNEPDDSFSGSFVRPDTNSEKRKKKNKKLLAAQEDG